MRIPPLVFTLLIITCVGCQKNSWETYTSNEGAFSVALPATPEETSEAVPSPAGDIIFHNTKLNQPMVLYEVSFADYPDTLFSIQSAEDIMEGLLYTYTVNGQVKPLKYSAIAMNGYSGREVEIFSPDGQLYIKARVYFVDERLYELTVITRKEHSRSVDIDQFLDSFQLIEPAEATGIRDRDSTQSQ